MNAPAPPAADFDAIPVIDIAAAADPRARPDLARRITAAAEAVGFLYVTGHATSPASPQAVMAAAADFFARPEAEKRRIWIGRSPHYRGYLGLLEKGDDPTFRGNHLEAFHCAEDLSADHPDVRAAMPLRGPNLWPDAPLNFHDVVDGYFRGTYRVGLTLLELLAEGLGLATDFFTRHYRHSLAQLRLLRYPQQDDPNVELLTRPHRDSGVITLLCQDDTGGLEVMNRAGNWVAAPPLAGACIINIGNTLQFWTGGRLASTNHRVKNLGAGAARYSLPFFMTPDYDTVVRALGTEADPAAPSLHVGEAMLHTYRRIWPSAAA